MLLVLNYQLLVTLNYKTLFLTSPPQLRRGLRGGVVKIIYHHPSLPSPHLRGGGYEFMTEKVFQKINREL